MAMSLDPIVGQVLDLQRKHKDTWADRPDAYWFARLVEEVGELGAALVDDHEHTPDWELAQIAAIAINWLRHRATP